MPLRLARPVHVRLVRRAGGRAPLRRRPVHAVRPLRRLLSRPRRLRQDVPRAAQPRQRAHRRQQRLRQQRGGRARPARLQRRAHAQLGGQGRLSCPFAHRQQVHTKKTKKFIYTTFSSVPKITIPVILGILSFISIQLT